jgi:hypothetical protein
MARFAIAEQLNQGVYDQEQYLFMQRLCDAVQMQVVPILSPGEKQRRVGDIDAYVNVAVKKVYISQLTQRQLPTLESRTAETDRLARAATVATVRKRVAGCALGQMLVAVQGVDICRSVVREARGEPFVSVGDCTNPEIAMEKVGLRAGLVLRGLTPQCDARDQSSLAAVLQIAATDSTVRHDVATIVGINERRKVDYWADAYGIATLGGKFADKRTHERELTAAIQHRPVAYRGLPEITDVVITAVARHKR